MRTHAGDWLWIQCHGRVIKRDAEGRAVLVAGTSADIAERKKAEDLIRQMAHYDELTGLPNRAMFNQGLQQALARAARAHETGADVFRPGPLQVA